MIILKYLMCVWCAWAVGEIVCIPTIWTKGYKLSITEKTIIGVAIITVYVMLFGGHLMWM